jgi:hypothetical protein
MPVGNSNTGTAPSTARLSNLAVAHFQAQQVAKIELEVAVDAQERVCSSHACLALFLASSKDSEDGHDSRLGFHSSGLIQFNAV